MTTSVKLNREEAREYLNNTDNGVILIGSPGVGKTTLIARDRMVSASLLAMEFQVNGIQAIKDLINPQIHYNNNVVVIDDLGIEEDVKHFGNGLDPIAYVIQRIYDLNQREDQNIKLIFTTNLNEKALIEKYGVRVKDRIWEMCDRIVLEDTNLRK